MNFVNCTPHALTVWGLGTIPASGIVPRCATVRTVADAIPTGEWLYCGSGDAIPAPATNECTPVHVRLVRQTMGQVTGLPDAQPDTIYIVSGMVLGALNGTRPDVVAPDTGPDAIRENGQITAVRGFVC